MVVVALLVVLLIKLARPQRATLVKPRAIALILGTLAIGSGIIVNLIFKDHWGGRDPSP